MYKGHYFFLLLCLILISLRFYLITSYLNNLTSQAKIIGRVNSISTNSWGKQIIFVNNLEIENSSKTLVSLGDLIIVVGNYKVRVINPIYSEKWLQAKDIKVTQKYTTLSTINRAYHYPLLEIKYSLYLFKAWAISRYLSLLSIDSAGLISGMTLGAGEVMPSGLYTTMKNSGLAHLVVASGSNIAIVAGMMLAILNFITKIKRYLISLGTIWIYTTLAGMEAPVVRAAIMISMIWIAQIMGRKTIAGWILLLTCLVMLLKNPTIIFSLSFQLSVAATTGLVLYSEHFQKIADKIGNKYIILGWLFGVAVQTLAAQVLILPLLLHYFSATNMLAIPANMAVGWLVTPIVIMGMLLLPIYSLSSVLAAIISLPLEIMLRYLCWIGHYSASFQFANVTWQMNWLFVMFWWLGAGGLWWWGRNLSTKDKNPKSKKEDTYSNN